MSKRNYSHIDKYLDELSADVYAQPSDAGHTEMTMDVLNRWIDEISSPMLTVLDVGCGAESIAEPFFTERDIYYTGISIGEDATTAQALGKNVLYMDMSFLEFENEKFDLVWARHVLEHSPMPLLTLMEWHRVAIQWLCVIVPNPTHFTYVGRNHYAVSDPHQLGWLLRRAGWKVVRHELESQEFRFLCEKQPRVSYEGYEEAPLSMKVHEAERDEFVVAA